ASLALGRRRRAMPRLVHSAAARDARGLRDDASALGGRPAERLRRRAVRRREARGRGPVTQLARRLGTFDAVVIGLGSMIGAGVFAAFSPAARSAGALLLVGPALAARVPDCHAGASAPPAA